MVCADCQSLGIRIGIFHNNGFAVFIDADDGNAASCRRCVAGNGCIAGNGV